MELEKLFWDIDDFCQGFIPIFEERMIPHKKRNRKTRLALSEIMTIIIHFHDFTLSKFQTFSSKIYLHPSQIIFSSLSQLSEIY